jgi:hypothetical protein
MKIILKYFPIGPQRGFFDSVEDIRGLSKTDQMGKFILLRSTWKAHINLHDVSSKIRSDKEINPDIHPLPQSTNPPQPSILKMGRRGIVFKSAIPR